MLKDFTHMYDLRNEIGIWDLGIKAIGSLILYAFGDLVHPLRDVS